MKVLVIGKLLLSVATVWSRVVSVWGNRTFSFFAEYGGPGWLPRNNLPCHFKFVNFPSGIQVFLGCVLYLMFSTDKVSHVQLTRGSSGLQRPLSLLNVNKGWLTKLQHFLPSPRMVIRDVPQQVFHLIFDHSWRGRRLLILRLLIKLSLFEDGAKPLVFAPLSPEHLYEGFFLVKSRVIVEYWFVFILWYCLRQLTLFIVLILQEVQDSFFMCH